MCGFFTTRIVEAVSPEQAAGKALALVAVEVKSLVVNSERPFGIKVEEVRAHRGRSQVAGHAFTWFDLDKPRMPLRSWWLISTLPTVVAFRGTFG